MPGGGIDARQRGVRDGPAEADVGHWSGRPPRLAVPCGGVDVALRPLNHHERPHARRRAAEGVEREGIDRDEDVGVVLGGIARKSTRLNSSHRGISYAVFCLKKKIKKYSET